MRLRCYYSALLVLVMLGTVNGQRVNGFDPRSVEVKWNLVANNLPGANQFTASLTFRSTSKLPIPQAGWSILFNLRYHTIALKSNTPAFTIKHISGDLFAIQPTEKFPKLLAGQSVTMEYWGNRLVANFQDVPAGLIWVNDDRPQVGVDMANVQIVSPEDGTRKNLIGTDGAAIFELNKIIEDLPSAQLPLVFPTARHYRQLQGTFSLDESVQIIRDDPFTDEAEYLSATLDQLLGLKIPVNGAKRTKTIGLKSASLSAEAYRISVTPMQVLLEAGDAAGMFYGIQSIKSMLSIGDLRKKDKAISLQCLEVSDAPRFPYRAFMLDVARNFQPKEEIFKVLELMSLYKLNVFHFHLTDDEGWRLEIPGLQELIDVGSNRGYPFLDNEQLHPSYGSGATTAHGDGFYSKEDYIEILRYAKQRHIRVVPEIESPAHARAAIKAMQHRYEKLMRAGKPEEANRYLLQDPNDKSNYLSTQYFRDNVIDVTLPSTFTFIEKVIDEIKTMHRDAGAPLAAIHMAGDEVPEGSWEKSPNANAFVKNHPQINSARDLRQYYFHQIKEMLKRKEIGMYGWQELVMGNGNADASHHVVNSDFLKSDVQVDAWWNLYGSEDVPYKLANTGYKTVLTFFDHFYFDLAYQNSFDEPGDGWIGFLDIDKTYSFIPFDYYKNVKTNLRGDTLATDFFLGKEKLTAEGRQNVVGVQGALWGENLVSPALMEYLLMPRLMALAERAWAQDPEWSKEDSPSHTDLYRKSWSTFCNVLGKRELPKLDYYIEGFNYRIPTPGVAIVNGKVNANIQLPGFTLRYTLDGSEPTVKSKIYSGPIEGAGTVKLSAFNWRGRQGKTITIVNK